MSAFMIATITVKDAAKFQEYLAKTQVVAARFGAELLARGTLDKVLTDHDGGHEVAVIVRFPSLEHIERWHESAEYQPLVPLRNEGAEMKIVSYAAAG